MIGKLFVVLAVFIAGGNSLTEIWLPPRDIHYIRHELLGTSMSIPKQLWDTLSTCHVIFPNNVMYEVYPRNTLVFENVFPLSAAQPFMSCGIGFRNVDTSFSGTYQLLSTVLHSADNSVSMTRQNFNLVVVESDFSFDKL